MDQETYEEYRANALKLATAAMGVPPELLTKPYPQSDPDTLDRIAADMGIIRKDAAPVEHDAPIEYGFLEGEPQRMTRPKCLILRLRRDHKKRRTLIKKLKYQQPRPHYRVMRIDYKLRVLDYFTPAFERVFKMSQNPYARDIVAMMDPADKSGEVIIMKGVNNGPTPGGYINMGSSSDARLRSIPIRTFNLDFYDDIEQ